ncbi:MAG: hypothetical protein U0J65_00525, partial [Christensenellales bacterium]|nr:hypothetical protein [Christensenellales bacterium]
MGETGRRNVGNRKERFARLCEFPGIAAITHVRVQYGTQGAGSEALSDGALHGAFSFKTALFYFLIETCDKREAKKGAMMIREPEECRSSGSCLLIQALYCLSSKSFIQREAKKGFGDEIPKQGLGTGACLRQR